MPLLTELERCWFGRSYKYSAPTALTPNMERFLQSKFPVYPPGLFFEIDLLTGKNERSCEAEQLLCGRFAARNRGQTRAAERSRRHVE